MNIESRNSPWKKREYIKSKTQYWYYEIDITSNNKKYFFLKIEWVEYIIPRAIFKHTIWIWNQHEWISDYVFDLTNIWINNNVKIVQPTPESLIVNTLTHITEFIQINNKDNTKVTILLNSIKHSVESLMETN